MKTSADETGQLVIKPKQQPQKEQSKPVSADKPSEKSSDKETYNAAMAAILAMQKKKTEAKKEEKIQFAGKSYSIEREKTTMDVKRESQMSKKKLGGACEGLDDLVQMINDKDKNVTCMDKTKLDWDEYTKENKLESELEQNRKDGYLQKRRFLNDVEEAEYQKKKQGVKESKKIEAMVEQAKLGK